MARESSLARLPMAAKIGISITILILGGLAYYVVFYSDVSSKIAAAESQQTKLEADLKKAKTAELAYQKDLEELARRRERERELNKVLPEQTEYPAFLSSVQSVANSSGVTLSAWTPQSEVKEEYYARVPMEVSLEGRFHQVAKFFYGVGQNERIMNMENISITDPKVVDDEVFVKVTALATAFRALGAEEAKEESKATDRRGRAKK